MWSGTRAPFVVLAAGVLSACGPPTSGAISDPPGPTPTSTSTPAAADLPAGQADPTALAGFSCGPDAANGWTATGTLTNTGQDAASYVVTVVVAGPDSTTEQAKRQIVALPSGASEPVEIDTLPVPAEGELSCQAQVVRRS